MMNSTFYEFIKIEDFRSDLLNSFCLLLDRESSHIALFSSVHIVHIVFGITRLKLSRSTNPAGMTIRADYNISVLKNINSSILKTAFSEYVKRQERTNDGYNR